MLTRLTCTRARALQGLQGRHGRVGKSTALSLPSRCLSVAPALTPTEDLSLPYSAVQHTNSTAALQPEKFQMSTLDNGMRVVSMENHSPIASLGVFVESGSRHDPHGLSGCAHFVEAMAFKANMASPTCRLVQDLGALGGNVMASAARDHTVFSAEALREQMPEMIRWLSLVSTAGAFDSWDVEDVANQFREQLTSSGYEPDIMDTVHAAAYRNTVGSPLIPTLDSLAQFPHYNWREHIQTMHSPDRMVLAGVGCSHKDLMASVEATFATLPKGPKVSEEVAEYVGGELRVPNAGGGLVHYILAFQSANWNDADLIPLTVLQMLMGGGGSFSAGGPGKGMYSRLYTNVLNQYHWAHSATSFNAIYRDTGLFGLYGQAEPEFAQDMVSVLIKETHKMAGSINQEELDRAKNQLKGAIFMHLESRGLLMEDLGRQIALFGKLETPQETSARVDKVTEKDIQRVATKMMKQAPSVAVHGDARNVPRYSDVVSQFQ